jgi:hypothetical protein
MTVADDLPNVVETAISLPVTTGYLLETADVARTLDQESGT